MPVTFSFANNTFPFSAWRPEYGKVLNGRVSLDTETTIIRESWQTPNLVLGAAFDGVRGVFIPPIHFEQFIKVHFENEYVFHNASFDLAVISRVLEQTDIYQLVDDLKVWDTRILFKLWTLATKGHTANRKGESSLDNCVSELLGLPLPKDVVDESGKDVRLSFGQFLGKHLSKIPVEYLEYLARDAIATLSVFGELGKRIGDSLTTADNSWGFVNDGWLSDQCSRWGPLTHHIQLKASIVLDQVAKLGIGVDSTKVAELVSSVESRQSELRTSLRESGWIVEGKGSGKSLQQVIKRLEQKNPNLSFPRTDTGKYSTDANAIAELKGEVEFFSIFSEFGSNQKLLSTFLKKLSKGRVHPSFDPLIRSGRTSSFGAINSQNLPREDRVRGCLVPSKKHFFIDCDYSTLEMATLSQAVISQFGLFSQMAERINSGQDLHRLVAAQFTGKEADVVSSTERQMAKPINFGKPGGMGCNGLIAYAKSSYGVDLSENEVERLSDSWFELFPEMRPYLERENTLGFDIASLLGLTPHAHYLATGKRGFIEKYESSAGAHEPNEMLGWMGRKTASSNAPSSREGVPYDRANIEFFWSALNQKAYLFKEEQQRQIRSRRPSPDLAKELSKLADLKPCVTATGRIRAKTNYCARRNTLFQGLAADGAKIAMWKLWRAGFKIVNFIHDEFLIEVNDEASPAETAREIQRLMIEGMRSVVPDVKIDVDSSKGKSWAKAELVEIKLHPAPHTGNVPVAT